MSLPRVTVLFNNGNLLQDIQALDGIAGLLATVSTAELIGAVKTVYNLEDAIEKGYTEVAEPHAYRHIREFYAELGGNQELWIQGFAETVSMAQMLDNTSATGAKKLTTAAAGRVRLIGVTRKPAAAYEPGEGFMDTDVHNALLNAKTFCEARLDELIPCRILVEGRIAVEAGAAYQPRTADIDYAGVVLGGSLADGSASVGTALGRAVKYGAHIKLGKVANGPLAIPDVYIGTKKINEVLNLSELHGAGFISFMHHVNKGGVYFGIDRMANTKDYRLLAYGRLVDKAAVICASVYVDELESEVEVDADGRISELDREHLKGRLEQAINVYMGEQISGVIIYIDPGQDIINTSRLKVKVSIRPLGYTSFIDIDLGLVAPSAA